MYDSIQTDQFLRLKLKRFVTQKISLIYFGVKSCYLTQKEAKFLYDESLNALKKGIEMVQEYIGQNSHFKSIGEKMIDSWRVSLDNRLLA